jgi:sugar/nucleoside kinase (ribokinase family)
MSVLIAGCIGIDEIRTPTEDHLEVVGGSASYAALSASYFGPVNLVGIVGTDFPSSYLDLFRLRKINLAGLQIADGKTFRWIGAYEADMNQRKTVRIELNLFAQFRPSISPEYRRTPFVLLGNMSPELQIHVLDQVQNPQFVAADTMDIWVKTARPQLLNLLPRIDLLMLNEAEARQLSQEENLVSAGRTLLGLGPKYVTIKKGAHGCLLMSSDEIFHCDAYPVEMVRDPTGAGDTFAGGLVGYLARQKGTPITFQDLKRGTINGSLMASFCVESFSVDRLANLSEKEIVSRFQSLVVN